MSSDAGVAMANRPRWLDPEASSAARLGAELRARRLARGQSQASLGRLVHVSGDLIGKIEKADRIPQLDLLARLDDALEAEGRFRFLGSDLRDDLPAPPQDGRMVVEPERALPVLRHVIDTVRDGDHAMRGPADVRTLTAYAYAVGEAAGRVEPEMRPLVCSAVGEAYQLAGWMSFDQGKVRRAELLLDKSRAWAQSAADLALAAYVLGPNLSFVATYSGQAALGVERAYGAWGWARRSGNRRLTAFTMTVAARAHARLGEATLSLDLLDRAHDELSGHTPDERDHGWLAVFDDAAIDGHRGSCLLDLGMPDRALDPLGAQRDTAGGPFVRNRVIWQLDRVDALLNVGEIDQACHEMTDAVGLAERGSITPRVRRRFLALGTRLGDLPRTGPVTDARERLREITAGSG